MSDQSPTEIEAEYPIEVPRSLAKLGYRPYNPEQDDPIFWLVAGYLETLGYTNARAEEMVAEYKAKFMNAAYCESVGILPQSEESLSHDGPAEIAVRIHYHIGLGGDPQRYAYLNWRTDFENSAFHAEWYRRLRAGE